MSTAKKLQAIVNYVACLNPIQLADLNIYLNEQLNEAYRKEIKYLKGEERTILMAADITTIRVVDRFWRDVMELAKVADDTESREWEDFSKTILNENSRSVLDSMLHTELFPPSMPCLAITIDEHTFYAKYRTDGILIPTDFGVYDVVYTPITEEGPFQSILVCAVTAFLEQIDFKGYRTAHDEYFAKVEELLLTNTVLPESMAKSLKDLPLHLGDLMDAIEQKNGYLCAPFLGTILSLKESPEFSTKLETQLNEVTTLTYYASVANVEELILAYVSFLVTQAAR